MPRYEGSMAVGALDLVSAVRASRPVVVIVSLPAILTAMIAGAFEGVAIALAARAVNRNGRFLLNGLGGVADVEEPEGPNRLSERDDPRDFAVDWISPVSGRSAANRALFRLSNDLLDDQLRGAQNLAVHMRAECCRNTWDSVVVPHFRQAHMLAAEHSHHDLFVFL